MLPTVRYRLRVEPLEDRALPAAPLPGGPAVDPSPPDSSDPDAAEYRPGSQPDDEAGDAQPSPPAGAGATAAPEYPAASDPRTATRERGGGYAAAEYGTIPYAPPATASFSAPPPDTPSAGLPPAPTSTPAAVGAVVAPDPAVTPHLVGPSPAADVAPPADQPAEPAVPVVSAVGRAVEAPAPVSAEPAFDPPLPDPVSSLAGLVDELAVRVDLPAGWDAAATRVLDTLAAAADDLLDPETGWVRLGYWAAAVAAVGVAAEVSRQAVRARRPADDPGPRPEVGR